MGNSKYQLYSSTQEAWDGMLQAITDAKESIYWELYIFIDDEAGTPFFDILEKKSRSGVDVKLIIDSLGSFGLPRRRIKSLKDAGVDLLFFSERKKRYRGLWKKMWSRTHRKILIVDADVGFIGGVNIQKHMKDWSDVHIRIQGTAVHSILRWFAKSYIISGGKKKNVKHLFKYRFRVASDIDDLEFVFDDADTKQSRTRKKYTEAFLKARERVILFSPYYFPDRRFLRALWKARRRGIKVDLLIPFRTDIRIATYAMHVWFSLMRKLGVNVHLTDKMMHGKGVIVDDDWAMVGSSNIDQVSFYDNYEANVKISEKKFVSNLKNTVQGWLDESEKMDEKYLKKRGRFQRWLDRTSFRVVKWWHRIYSRPLVPREMREDQSASKDSRPSGRK